MIHLTVNGLPAPQGSKTRMPNGAMVDGTSKKARANLAAWRDAVRSVCRDHLDQHPGPPIAEPMIVTLHFRFPPTKSDPYRYYVATTPDVDKLIRSTFDAMKQGGLIVDDSYVVRVIAEKTYASEWVTLPVAIGCDITVAPVGHQEAEFREVAKARAARARKEARRSA